MSLGNSATPLRVNGGTTLNLVVAGTNEIVSVNAGIAVPSGASLVISRAPGYDNATAVLEARGGDYCAGIGGNKQGANGAITINGATVIARGGAKGSGIGSGGYSGSTPYPTYAGGDVTINGGRVFAYGNDRGAGIGGGHNVQYSGAVTIAGGVVKAQGAYVGVGSGTPARRPVSLTVRVTGGNFRPKYTWGSSGNSCDYADATIIDADGRSCVIYQKSGFEPWQRVFAKNVPSWFGTQDLAADEEGVVWLWTSSSSPERRPGCSSPAPTGSNRRISPAASASAPARRRSSTRRRASRTKTSNSSQSGTRGPGSGPDPDRRARPGRLKSAAGRFAPKPTPEVPESATTAAER